MEEQTFLRSILNKMLSTVIRHGLSGFGVWLAAKHLGTLNNGTVDNLTDIIIGIICVAISGAYSVYKAHTSQKTVVNLQKSMLQVGASPSPSNSTGNPILGLIFVGFMMGAMTGCASISKFDQNSYNSALELKSQSLTLIQKAKAPAEDYNMDIASLRSRLSAALAYEQGKSNNVISAKQWDILISEDHNLVGKFLKDWIQKKQFSDPYLLEKKQQISDGYDQILRLESAKPR